MTRRQRLVDVSHAGEQGMITCMGLRSTVPVLLRSTFPVRAYISVAD